MNKKTWWILALWAVVLVLSGCGTAATTSSTETVALAECLSAKGAIMYGTERCPHCQNQKKLFGEAFEKINFVDCDKEKNVCQLAWVTGYPTWKFADGTVLQGTQTLEILSSAASCSIDSTTTGENITGDVSTSVITTWSENSHSGNTEVVSGEIATGIIIQEVATGSTSTGS